MIQLLNVYFGGSFFPPHLGHDQMLCHLLCHSDVSKVYLIPTFQNPLKEEDPLWTPSPQRKRSLMNAWLESLQKRNVKGLDKLVLDWREVESQSVNYTVDTLALLESENPQSRWALCVGDDCLPDLMKWKNVRALLERLAEVWIFRRDLQSSLYFVDKIPASLRDLCVWRCLVPEILSVSSTQLREEFRRTDARHDVLSSWLLPEVAQLLVDPPR
jgi:nicotinate (nicotinamide) nucleotide adenylyltransferase